jgi:hypothetical protein
MNTVVGSINVALATTMTFLLSSSFLPHHPSFLIVLDSFIIILPF